jgi:hypothetical protein
LAVLVVREMGMGQAARRWGIGMGRGRGRGMGKLAVLEGITHHH